MLWFKGSNSQISISPFLNSSSQNRVNGIKINKGKIFPVDGFVHGFNINKQLWNTSELFFSRRFSGLRSLWATLRLWHRYTASVIWRRYLAAFLSVNPLSLLILSKSSPPSINSITINKRALKT